jgi:polysaccharide biosynthesis/export protein
MSFCLMLVCASFLLAAGCASGPRVTGDQAMAANAKLQEEGDKDTVGNNFKNMAALWKAESEGDYHIGPEDVLDIDVFQVDDLKRTVTVSANGYIGFPLLGHVKVAGRTAHQLESELAGQFDRYVINPQVTVSIKEYRSQRVAVTGSVRNPNVYAVTGQKHLLDLLLMAGGPTEKDLWATCYVSRPLPKTGGTPGEAQTIAVDLVELLERGNQSLNIPVFGGDIINVPRPGVVFVDGAVKKPGMFPLTGRNSLVQIMALAGGANMEADLSAIHILRMGSNGNRQIITVDYNRAKTGVEYPIKDNDIVLVPRSGWKSFVAGLFTMVKGSVAWSGNPSVGIDAGQPWGWWADR